MSKHNRSFNRRQHQLSNKLLRGISVKQLKEDIINARIENDQWYAFNIRLLKRNYGKIAGHVFRNVKERLDRIARSRALANA